ncbi:hypothetical protein D3C80_2002450 [compost metagenome]
MQTQFQRRALPVIKLEPSLLGNDAFLHWSDILDQIAFAKDTDFIPLGQRRKGVIEAETQ